MFKIFLVFISLISLISQAADLKLTVGPNPTMVLPVSMPSCESEQQGIFPGIETPSPVIEYGFFKYQWTGTESTLKLSYMTLEFKDKSLEGGQYICTIAGNELYAILNGRIEFSPGDSTVYQATCGIRCGGIQFIHMVNSVRIDGTLKVVGVEYDAKDNGKRFITEVPISIKRGW